MTKKLADRAPVLRNLKAIPGTTPAPFETSVAEPIQVIPVFRPFFKTPVYLIKVFHTNTSLDLSRMTKQEYTTIVDIVLNASTAAFSMSLCLGTFPPSPERFFPLSVGALQTRTTN